MLHYLEVIGFFSSCTNMEKIKVSHDAMQAGGSATKGKKPRTQNSNLRDGATIVQISQQTQQSMLIPFSYLQFLMVSRYVRVCVCMYTCMFHFPLYRYM